MRKKTEKYISKANLIDYFLQYEEKYVNLRRINIILWVSFLYMQMMLIIFRESFYGLILLGVLIFFVLYFRKKNRISFEEYDVETSEEFITYLDSLGAKRKKSFKDSLKKIEDLIRSSQDRTKFSARKIIINIIYSIIFIVPSMFIFSIISIILFPEVIIFLNNQFGILLFDIYAIFPLSLGLSLMQVVFYIDLLNYSNVRRCSELFRFYLENKLFDIEMKLDLFVNATNNEINKNEFDLLPILQKWYEFYCTRYSTNDKINAIMSQYHDLIFTPDDEYYYLESFSDVKGKLIDFINSLSLQEKVDSKEIEKWEKILSFLNNYIMILQNSIERKADRVKLLREKRSSRQSIFYMIISPISLTLSLIAVIIQSVFLFLSQ